MSGMDQFLAEHYGNVPTSEPSEEDIQKVAQAEMFLKLAAQNGVDINTLNDAQINQLWEQVWDAEKTAAPAETAPEETAPAEAPAATQEEKLAEAIVSGAQEEYSEIKEAQEKFAEADYMGKTMAHSYVAELRNIAEQGGLDFMKEAGGKEEAAKKAPGFLKRMWGKRKELVEAGERAAAERKVSPHVKGDDLSDAAHKARSKAIWLGRGAKAAPYAAGALAAGGAAKGVHSAVKHRGKKEEEGKTTTASASNFDIAAADLAIQKLAANNWDTQEGFERLNALLTLGVDDISSSEKVAAAQDFQTAVDYRSSELLEMAGYPINWAGTPFEKSAETKAEEKKEEKKEKHEEGETAADEKKEEAALKQGSIADLPPETQFDLMAGDLAIQKAAEVGWNSDEALERVRAVLTLGAGNPAESQKLANIQDEQTALTVRACELLEMAGYKINW